MIPLMRLRARVLALILPALGCSSAVKHLFTAPTVAFRGVSLESITPLGGRVRVNLLVRNPNAYSLSTSGMTYELFVRDTVGLASGADTVHRTLGGHDSLLVALPLDVSLRGILAAGNAVVGYGMVPYRLVGTITADTPIGARKIPFDQRGEFAPVQPR
jgi:LEA14-like dessication related protein